MKSGFVAKLARWWMVALFSVIIIALATVAFFFIRALRHEDYIVSASGRQHSDIRVFYTDNDLFEENPIPGHLDFMMSHTDYIELHNSFSADFSAEMEIYYSYHAVKRFVVRHLGTTDPERFVYEEVFVLSDSSGQTVASRLNFRAYDDGEPGGVYTLFPHEYIDAYFAFVAAHADTLEQQSVIAPGFRGFSADLHIDFTYTLYSPEFGLHEVIAYGYIISLTTEIYTFIPTGTPAFNWQTNLIVQRVQITLPMALIFTAFLAVALIGLLFSLSKLREDPDSYHREVNLILRKYSNEIVIYDSPTSITKYEPRIVSDFDELLKLAVNLNKHIMCYTDDNFTEFTVIVDDFACIYKIHRDGESAMPIMPG